MVRSVFIFLVVAILVQSDATLNQAIGCSPNNFDCKPCLRPGTGEPGNEVRNKPPDVTELDLDRSELKLKKHEDPDKPPAYDNELHTDVTTTAADPEGDVLTYNYTIPGGRIVGTGAKVRWDLNGVQAGTYTITVGVDDGCGICGKTVTRSVTIVQD